MYRNPLPTIALASLMTAVATSQGPAVDVAPPPPADAKPMVLGPRAAFSSTALHDNGALINSTGTGANGADESVLMSITHGMGTFGMGNNIADSDVIADQFTVPAGTSWQVDRIDFYGYQTNASSAAPTIDDVRVVIYDRSPHLAGATVMFGDYTTNRIQGSATWSGAYRVTESSTGTLTNRAIMVVSASIGTALAPGEYWVAWQFGGDPNLSGPYVPPIAVTGPPVTGRFARDAGRRGQLVPVRGWSLRRPAGAAVFGSRRRASVPGPGPQADRPDHVGRWPRVAGPRFGDVPERRHREPGNCGFDREPQPDLPVRRFRAVARRLSALGLSASRPESGASPRHRLAGNPGPGRLARRAGPVVLRDPGHRHRRQGRRV